MSVRATPRPATDLASRDVIVFHHPGYLAFDVLLTLPRVDTTPSEPDKFGVHHATALLACQIIRNNAFNGYLSTSRHNPEGITTAADGALMEDNYFFIVPGNVKYPIVPSFQDWKFPHTEFQRRLWWPNMTTEQNDPVCLGRGNEKCRPDGCRQGRIPEQYGHTSAADSEAEAEEKNEGSTHTPWDPVKPNIHLRRLKQRLEMMKRRANAV